MLGWNETLTEETVLRWSVATIACYAAVTWAKLPAGEFTSGHGPFLAIFSFSLHGTLALAGHLQATSGPICDAQEYRVLRVDLIACMNYRAITTGHS
eukprot:2708051-Pyramimonas_sp.AAC.2